MDRILIILKKEMAQGLHLLNTIIFKYVYWYMKQISGERLQDHWSSGFCNVTVKYKTFFRGCSISGASLL